MPNSSRETPATGALSQTKLAGADTPLAEAITAARYRVRLEEAPATISKDQVYRSPNPAHHFDAYFTPAEMTVVPFSDEDSGQPRWKLAMKLEGVGYGNGW